ncbi:MAG: hypothetical protein ACREBI_09640 [Nitrosotalea sp.]
MSDKNPLDLKELEKKANKLLDNADYKSYKIESMLIPRDRDVATVIARSDDFQIILTLENTTGKLLAKSERHIHSTGIAESTIQVSAKLAHEIQKNLQKDDDTLYEEIARYHELRFGHRITAKIDYKKRGREIFYEIQEMLYKKVCIDFQFCKRSNRLKSLDPISQAALVFQIAYGASGEAIPIWVAIGQSAALIVKAGLSRFCKCA